MNLSIYVFGPPHQKKWPPKSNMTMGKQPFEDVSPIKKVIFQ